MLGCPPCWGVTSAGMSPMLGCHPCRDVTRAGMSPVPGCHPCRDVTCAGLSPALGCHLCSPGWPSPSQSLQLVPPSPTTGPCSWTTFGVEPVLSQCLKVNVQCWLSPGISQATPLSTLTHPCSHPSDDPPKLWLLPAQAFPALEDFRAPGKHSQLVSQRGINPFCRRVHVQPFPASAPAPHVRF